MSDMRITLPGSETVTLTGQTVDKLIRAGDGDAALLYLYILKTNGKSTSSEAAIALDKSKGWVASAMAMLSRLGLVQLDGSYEGDAAGSAGAGVSPGSSPGAIASGAASAEAVSPGVMSESLSGGSAKAPFEEPRQYTENEVKNELISGSDFAVVVDETQRRLGKILSPDELLRLFGIYDYLRLPPEVIMQLITHCIKECGTTGDGRAPSVRYIEKEAYKWEREGLFTLERAEEYLKALEAKKSVRGEIKKALQIKDREFSATEKRYVDDWIGMGLEPDAIAVAYDKTVVKTGKLTWAYIDKILSNWHNKGIHTAQQVLEKDGGRKQGSAAANVKPGTQKHSESDYEEMERMRRLLKKVKEE